jgi:hypothetical protein
VVVRFTDDSDYPFASPGEPPPATERETI